MDKSDERKKEEEKIFRNIVLQIRDVVKEDLSDNKQGFNEEKQQEVVRILQNNFDLTNQQIGKIFLEDTIMFHRDTGEIFDCGVHFFLSPMLILRGYKVMIPNICYPTYNIRNKYMGYWEKEKFHKAPSEIIKFIRSINWNS